MTSMRSFRLDQETTAPPVAMVQEFGASSSRLYKSRFIEQIHKRNNIATKRQHNCFHVFVVISRKGGPPSPSPFLSPSPSLFLSPSPFLSLFLSLLSRPRYPVSVLSSRA